MISLCIRPLLLEGIVGMSDGLGSEKEGSSAAAALNTSGASDTVNGGGSDAGEDDGIPGNPVGQLQVNYCYLYGISLVKFWYK